MNEFFYVLDEKARLLRAARAEALVRRAAEAVRAERANGRQ